jgi:hypothetical protein
MRTDICRKAILWITLAVLTLSCSQLGGVIPIAPTSNLLTPEQIAGVNLEQQLFLPGDLPDRFAAGKPGSATPERFKDFPPAQYRVSVELTEHGSWAGNATVFLYSNTDDIEKAFNPTGAEYDEILALAGLGEKSSVMELSMPYGTGATTIDMVNAQWVRCSAVVEVRLITKNSQEAKDYALALDRRIAPLVCNNGQAPVAGDAAAVEPTVETAAEATATKTVKPSPLCPYQADTDLATITAIIEAEATAANNEDISIIAAIFAPNALLIFEQDGTEWHDPISRYTDLFDAADIVDSTHFGIQPAGDGITANKAWFISGSSGTYIPNDGEPLEYYNEPGKDQWVLQRNFYGCWVITEFRFS